ncbi:hypothetical protein Csa_017262 [Cucumis sativus]|uniref:Uncharacterized protein n=1 Tax=Cucumis sativus TaxID=3659 RepID=A0A0A0K3W4_CUCSA|nr:hypothetical protein Csa_017262 [Cucumis sativus]
MIRLYKFWWTKLLLLELWLLITSSIENEIDFMMMMDTHNILEIGVALRHLFAGMHMHAQKDGESHAHIVVHLCTWLISIIKLHGYPSGQTVKQFLRHPFSHFESSRDFRFTVVKNVLEILASAAMAD